MKTLLKIFLACFLILLATTYAYAIPDLKKQGQWGDTEKKSFLKFLDSGKQLPIRGQVKEVKESLPSNYSTSKASYLNFNIIGQSLFTRGRDGVRRTTSSNIGGRFLYGNHIFSWVRWYTGLQYSLVEQAKKSGEKESLSHFQIPFGVELALIPLGTPHTRYAILRGGVTAHYFSGDGRDEEFENPLFGTRGSYDLALGYEWQFSDSRWRYQILIEGQRSISREKGNEFSSGALSTGFVFTI